MKITRQKVENKVPFDKIKINEGFEYEGNIYLRVSGVCGFTGTCYNTIDLTHSANPVAFENYEVLVKPLEIELIIKET